MAVGVVGVAPGRDPRGVAGEGEEVGEGVGVEMTGTLLQGGAMRRRQGAALAAHRPQVGPAPWLLGTCLYLPWTAVEHAELHLHLPTA